MKKFDKIIIIFFICLAIILGVFFKLNKKTDYVQKYVEIYVKGNLYKKINLQNNTKEKITIKTDLGENIVQIENGGVRIIESDCPDKICVKDGFRDKAGEILVCLPHKLVVQIKGESKSDIDEVSY
ncbi:NusG domain II-containing protein [Clostridium brassicae]|uniref:NusG domain II-containing protein n=1 Tax=Clostridium brassicae TaxID=2999072 RepID=A0ABT4DFT5_9CLOT|nr:NusG domain II-containing protein [Clostridium brassicae]MCY6960543.1 NusG domain II-containing protein [Clostridium brassicae]